MRITSVDVVRLTGTLPPPVHGAGQWQAHPLHHYAEHRPTRPPTRPTEPRPLTELFVEITAEDGTVGRFGPIFRAAAHVIRDQLASFLAQRDALAIEALHDRLLRLDRHARAGHYLMAVSAVDCALWDLKGKLLDQPVHRLLGGPTRQTVPCYASMLGYPVEPTAAAATAAAVQSEGWPAQKWFFPHGPGSGEAGLAANLALAHAVRAAVGPHYPLMFDAFMGWDLPFAQRMLAGLAPLQPTWMEEPLPPEQLDGFRRLKAAHPAVPLATGEHIYGRWQTYELVQSRAVDVLQNDPDWTGGITELLHVCSLGSAASLPVIAHGHSLLPALHVAAARPPTTVPWVEFLLSYQSEKQHFFATKRWPHRGHLAPPAEPGLGLELDPAAIESRGVFTG
jgi:L-rhamnonate dehydratase